MSILFDPGEAIASDGSIYQTRKTIREASDKQGQTGISKNFDDLLVVGYHSKLFRDDVMAQYIHDGRHLIPWMGNEKIMIDR